MTKASSNHGRLRVAIAGISTESSTFSPHHTTADDFTVRTGSDLLARYPWVGAGSRWCSEVDWVPLLHAIALPGGPVERETYDNLRNEILRLLLDSGPLDGLLFDVHGAMSVFGLTDAEGDLISTIRAAVGSRVMISASMDLHGNVSRSLVEQLDLMTCFRTAPHEDELECRERAARHLIGRLQHGRKPIRAWVTVPVLLPGEMTSTRLEPARSLYSRVADVERLPGVVDAAVWVGYPWADETRCRATVVVTGDDHQTVYEQAHDLAKQFWDARRRFRFVAPADSIERCVHYALSRPAQPFFISDSGDNPTAGGAGDVSYTLSRLVDVPRILDGSVQTIYASIVDPGSVEQALSVGIGAQAEFRIGGKIDARPSGPAVFIGVVHAIRRGDPVGGDIVVVRAAGLHVILTSRRKPYHHIADFADLGLDAKRADIVIVKIGYLEPELFEAAKDWMLALTPGSVDQDLLRLGYQHLERPLFPFDPEMPQPDLLPEVLMPAAD